MDEAAGGSANAAAESAAGSIVGSFERFIYLVS